MKTAAPLCGAAWHYIQLPNISFKATRRTIQLPPSPLSPLISMHMGNLGPCQHQQKSFSHLFYSTWQVGGATSSTSLPFPVAALSTFFKVTPQSGAAMVRWLRRPLMELRLMNTNGVSESSPTV